MIIYIDIDKIVCDKDRVADAKTIPDQNMINKINMLYRQDHYIVYWTTYREEPLRQELITKLQQWNCMYHEISYSKPAYDMLIDSIDDEYSEQIYQFSKKHYHKFNELRGCMPPMENMYHNKKICILGAGKSIEKHNIIFSNYDIVVGINRLYKTNFIKNINILYHNLSIVEWPYLHSMITTLKENKNFKEAIFCPWYHKKEKKIYLYNLLDHYRFTNYVYNNTISKSLPEIKKRPLTGISALNHIILSKGEHIDLYGFDFYQEPYTQQLNKFKQHFAYHNIPSNKAFFLQLLSKNPNIKWYQ